MKPCRGRRWCQVMLTQLCERAAEKQLTMMVMMLMKKTFLTVYTHSYSEYTTVDGIINNRHSCWQLTVFTLRTDLLLLLHLRSLMCKCNVLWFCAAAWPYIHDLWVFDCLAASLWMWQLVRTIFSVLIYENQHVSCKMTNFDLWFLWEVSVCGMNG